MYLYNLYQMIFMTVRESLGGVLRPFSPIPLQIFRGHVFCFLVILVGSLFFEKMLNPWQGELDAHP